MLLGGSGYVLEEIDFSFIRESVLRENVSHVFHDILSLGLVLSGDNVSSQVVNCLKKTVVIYTASIIEALVLWKIRQEIEEERVILKNEWKYYDPKLIHTTDEYEIIWAKRKEEERSTEKIDFNVMVRICRNEKLFRKKLLDDLDMVRKLRNEIHIHGLEGVAKNYQQKKVDFVQRVLVETVRAVG